MLTRRKRPASRSASGSNTWAFAVMPCRHSAAGLEVVLGPEVAEDAVMHFAPGPQRHRRGAPPAHHVAAIAHVAFEQDEGMLGVLEVGAIEHLAIFGDLFRTT